MICRAGLCAPPTCLSSQHREKKQAGWSGPIVIFLTTLRSFENRTRFVVTMKVVSSLPLTCTLPLLNELVNTINQCICFSFFFPLFLPSFISNKIIATLVKHYNKVIVTSFPLLLSSSSNSGVPRILIFHLRAFFILPVKRAL
eukprot:TRINITY_DN10224_c0_g2_i1.p1 TRINITY_DN10224_c0_g2~~TRINITY_DN10224_c0_g2_i1.p1  ORF type:complete len:143 (+),score=2.33 TRINITY_DN10224_c0_g2_i1:655-1083(+)